MAERYPYLWDADFSTVTDWVAYILSSFFRRLVLPFFQSHGKKILANAVKTTVEVADDVLGEKALKESAKTSDSYGYEKNAPRTWSTVGIWCS